MMPAAKHGDPQLGVDVHLCVVPPSPSPVPLPTPHMSVVFDPMDYLPFIGATVTVCGMKRAVAGTAGQAVHIPPGFPFAPKLPDKDDELFMGSATVEADGDPFSFLGVPVLACQAVGMPSPPRPRRKGGPRIMMLPTVFNLAIPTNVFVGGPPTISLMGMAFKAGLAGLGKLARSNFARAIGARFQAWRKAKFGHLKPGFLKCKILRAEPVNIVTGAVSVEQQDFALPGLIPIVWNRRYASDNARRGACGTGWETPADARLEHDAESGVVLFHHPEGDIAIFPAMPAEAGEAGAVLELMDGARLSDHGDEFRVRTKEDRIYRFPKAFAATTPEGVQEYPLHLVRDLCGNALLYERDAARRLVAIHESSGRRIEIEHGPNGFIRRIALHAPDTGLRHVFVEYEQDAAGDLVAVRDALGHPYRFAYDAHHLVRHTDRNDLSFHYEYARRPEGWQVVRAWGDGGLHAYRFAYLDAVNERRITDSLGHVSLVKLDERGLPISEVDPLGGRTIFEYDEAGRTTAVVDADGHRTEFAFDARGNLTRLTRADGSVMEARYNDLDKPVRVTDPDGKVWTRRFDERGLLEAEASPSGRTWRYTHDSRGLRKTEESPCGRVTRFDHDSFGHLSAIADGRGGRQQCAYDPLGRILETTDMLGRRTRFRHDAAGRIVEMRHDGASRGTEIAYDPGGRVVSITDPDGACRRIAYRGLYAVVQERTSDGGTILYEHDTEERLVGVRNQRGEWHRKRRDALGRIVEETDYWGRTRRYTLTLAGKLTSVTDPLGRTIAYRTDGLRRVLERNLLDPDAAAGPCREAFAYDASGRLVAFENDTVRVERSYDDDGNLVEERQGEDAVVRHGYDEDGNRVSRIVEMRDGDRTIRRSVHFTYDSEDRLEGVTVGDHAPIGIVRDALGRPVEERWGDSLLRRSVYRQDGAIVAFQLLRAGRPLLDQSFDYDASGNLALRRDSFFGEDRFAYDDRGRLTAHQWADGGREHFVCDPLGDRLRLIARGADGSCVREGPSDGSRYRFGPTGELLRLERAGRGIDLRWDAYGRLVSSVADGVETTYAYDALGRRVAKSTGGRRRRFCWSGETLVAELFPADAPGGTSRLREWIHHPGTHVPLAVHDGTAEPEGGTSELFLVHTDPNGCPTRLFAGDGSTAWAARYRGWGRALPEASSRVDNPLRLRGQYEDEETGLHYNRFRYYDPSAGQFISQDPLGLLPGENPYAFAPNVQGWSDPLGLDCADDLRNATRARARQLADKSHPDYLSNRKRGPVVAGVFDPVTGKTFFGINQNAPPSALSDVLQKRISGVPGTAESIAKHGPVGSHAEIHALNQAILAREAHTGQKVTEADLPSFMLHNTNARGAHVGTTVPPPCPEHCAPIVNGVTFVE